MRFAIRRSGVGMVLSMFFALTAPQAAKAYQVDCAILLCLAGGWPASAECAHARAVFIRRITPWPIEPPLQIWRCPMGIADRKPMQSAAPESWEAHDQKVPAFAQVILAQVVDGGWNSISCARSASGMCGTTVIANVAATMIALRATICASGPTVRRANSAGNARHQPPPHNGSYRHGAVRHQIGGAGSVSNGKIT